jgi:hypothetical protein
MPTSVDELSRRGRIFRLLLALREQSPMTAKQFELASGASAETAKGLRKDMLEADIIEVRVLQEKGAVSVLAIELTPRGARAAAHLWEMDKALRED